MSGELGKAQNSLQKLGSSMTSLGTKMTAGITAPLVGAGVAIFKTFADFESVMAELQARTGSTADEMKKMSDFAIKMGRDTSFSATQAAEALVELTSSGSSAAEAMEQLPAVLDLAAAGALGLGEAADGVTDILAQFQLEASDSAAVANELAKAAGASSATVSDMIQAFGNVGPVAAQFGLSVNETAAAIATFSENGVKGAEAGTLLKSMLLNMTADTIPVRAAWEDLGLSMYDAAGNMRDIDDIFKDINIAMADMTMKEQNDIARALGGSYGIVGFNALRASNGISSMQDAMTGAAGASEVADARMNTLAGRFSSLMGSLETLAIVLGGLGEGPLTAFIKMLTDVINKVTEWAQANPKLAQMVMVILAIVAALGPLLVIIGSIVGAIGTLAAAFSAGGVLASVGAAIAGLAVPIGVVIAAITALSIAWQTNFLGIRTLIQNIGNGFAEFGRQLEIAKESGNGFFTVWEDGSTRVGEILKKFGVAEEDANRMGQNFVRNSKALAENIKMLVEIIVLSLKKLSTAAFEIGKNIVQGLINGISGMISSLVNKVKEMASKAANSVKSAFGIASPSKLMMKYGEQVVQGFNKGIDTMGGIGVQTPALAPAGASVSPTASGSPAFGGNGRSGVTVIIENLNVPLAENKAQIDYIVQEIGKKIKLKGGG